MKWFMKMKIGAKLITGFIIVALLSAAMGVFSMVNVKALSDSDTELYENMLIPTEMMADISQNFLRQRVQIRQALLSDDRDVIDEQLEKIQSMREEADVLDAAFEEKILSDKMHALFDEYKAAKEAYRPLLDQAMGYIDEGKKESAIALLADDGKAGIAAFAEMEAIENVMEGKVADGDGKAAANTAQANSVMTVTIIVMVVVFALSIMIGLLISSVISRPIRDTAKCAKALASGDLDMPLSVKSEDEAGQLAATIDGEVRQAFKDIEKARVVADKQARYQSAEVDKLVVNLERLSAGELYCDMQAAEPDEDTRGLYDLYGRISDNMHLTVNTLKTYIAEIAETLGAMSEGDLTVSIDSEFRGDFVELKQSINGIAQSLSDVMAEINIASEQVAAGTSQVSEGSQAISQGATEQAGSVEELSATITEIAEQTKQNAESAGEANKLTLSAKNDAGQGSERMQEMQNAMTEINEASENISKIIKVIDDIAFQTNILALNAAVEAARAGVHGKGFAVVAEEVRNLAAKSADAANQTTALIEGSVKKAEAGTRIADETAQALMSIVTGVEQAAALVGEIASASETQAGAITQVNGGIDQVSQVVQTNSATSEETAASAEELSSQAELLKKMVGRFRIKEEEKTKPGAKPREETKAKAEENPDASAGEEDPQIDLNDEDFGKY